LELVHTDIWGPASVKATSGAKYFILFLDDYSRYTWFYPLHTKDQALSTFKQFKLQVENQFDTRIKRIQSDNGGEFKCFMSFLQQFGILHRFSCPYQLKMDELRESIGTLLRLGWLCWLMLPYQCHFGNMLSRQLRFSSTECLARYSIMPHHISLFFTKNLTTDFLESLAVCVIHSSVLTTITSCSIDLSSALFLAIVSITKAIYVLILPLDESTLLLMLCLMNTNSLLLNLLLQQMTSQTSFFPSNYKCFYFFSFLFC